jgi:predicted RNase H-like nuclease (RuvC/YqgF family)
MNTGTVLTDQNLQVEHLIAQFDEDNSETKKSAEMQRQIHHQKRIDLLDKQITTLKNQQSNLNKSMWFGFAMNVVSKLLDLASKYLGPIGAPIAKGVGVVMQSLEKFNPFSQKASKAATKAAELENNAETERQKFEKENQKVQSSIEHRQVTTRRLEKTLQDLQQSQEATVRI